MKRKLSAAVFFAAVTILGFGASAGAVDGTIEINQAKVTANGGVFPYTIRLVGSYRLTGNLIVPASTNGINVTSSGVTIDLNGFSIIGTGSSSATPIGIDTSDDIVTVENGTVTGFGTGVLLASDGTVRNVHADLNFNGIEVSNNSVVTGCTANSGAGTGIQCAATCAITGNTANGNSTAGIVCGNPGSGDACVIAGNTVIFDGTGINCAGSGCLITGNTVHNSTLVSISAADSTTGYGGNVLYGNPNPPTGGTSFNNNLCSGTGC